MLAAFFSFLFCSKQAARMIENDMDRTGDHNPDDKSRHGFKPEIDRTWIDDLDVKGQKQKGNQKGCAVQQANDVTNDQAVGPDGSVRHDFDVGHPEHPEWSEPVVRFRLQIEVGGEPKGADGESDCGRQPIRLLCCDRIRNITRQGNGINRIMNISRRHKKRPAELVPRLVDRPIYADDLAENRDIVEIHRVHRIVFGLKTYLLIF